jgi:RHS repeat-associated protein
MHSVSLKFLVGILSFSDYYPFGMQMVGRNDPGDGYRYGFQGQETDDEWTGSESHVAFTYRCHDARLGRFFAVDPLSSKYPHYSPYSFSGNQVINAVELEGLEPSVLSGPTAKKTTPEGSSVNLNPVDENDQSLVGTARQEMVNTYEGAPQQNDGLEKEIIDVFDDFRSDNYGGDPAKSYEEGIELMEDFPTLYVPENGTTSSPNRVFKLKEYHMAFRSGGQEAFSGATKSNGNGRASNVVRSTGDIHYDTAPGRTYGTFSIDYTELHNVNDQGVIEKVMNVQVRMDISAGYSFVFKLKFVETATN